MVRNPHRQTLVREDDLDVDAIARMVLGAPRRVGAGTGAQLVLALETLDANPVRPMALGDLPLHPKWNPTRRGASWSQGG